MSPSSSIGIPALYARDDILLWEVRDAFEAMDMGQAVDSMGLGQWEMAVIGLGPRHYFDLTLARDVEPFLVKLIFGALPFAVY